MPKRPIGDRAMSNTERSRLWRERRRAELDALRSELERLRPEKSRRQAAATEKNLPSASVTD